ncbi:MAG: DUF547 domain-containing protein [Deltaproteobacteria bacterium]|nr:DUF547 domain-containing protein [Deltaproteobacteria bacterium]
MSDARRAMRVATTQRRRSARASARIARRALLPARAWLLLMALCVATRAAALDHDDWSALLGRYVDEQGQVAYRDLAAQSRPALAAYLTTLATAQPNGWSRDDQLAFWLNAYNAAIVNAVLQGRSAESLLSRYGLFYRYELELAGKPRTPDAVENQIIRPAGEPRIHFALVCASTSCPKLRRQAWTAATLDADLDAAARAFLRDPLRNQIRAGAPAVRLSSIFKWFRDDFGGSDDRVRGFVARYVEEPERTWLLEQKPPIEYLDYDWTLNAQPGQRPE